MIYSKREYFVHQNHSPLHYNPSLIQFNNRTFLISRCQDDILGNSWLTVNELDGDYKVSWYKRLEIHSDTAEDPRATIYGDKIYVFWNNGCPYYPIIGKNDFTINVSIYDFDWKLIESHPLTYKDRQPVEKNWTMFNAEGCWYCIYSFNPWIVLKFDENWNATKVWEEDFKLPWLWGQIRGGALPITILPQTGKFIRTRLVTKQFVFFHSSFDPMKELGMKRQYIGGLISFDEQFPFKPTGISRHPVIIPDLEARTEVQANVSYPAGAIYRDGKWIVSIGSGDCECKIMEFNHNELINSLNFYELPIKEIVQEITNIEIEPLEKE